MRKLNLHWFCTQNHILEPFSVRRACTQCYVTSEPYPRPSQIWCQNVRETRKKIVIKCRGESFARCRVIERYVEGGGHHGPPPSLIRVKAYVILMWSGAVPWWGGGEEWGMGASPPPPPHYYYYFIFFSFIYLFVLFCLFTFFFFFFFCLSAQSPVMYIDDDNTPNPLW